MFLESHSHLLFDVQPGKIRYFQMPNGTTAQSKATGFYHLANSTGPPIKAYVFDDNSIGRTLIGAADICNNGRTVSLTQDSCKIHEGEKLIFSTSKKSTEKLWEADLTSLIQHREEEHTANLAIHHELNADYVKFVHASFFSPAVSTFVNALRKNWLFNFPRITADMVSKNPPHSKATAMGHLNQIRQGLQSTKHVAYNSSNSDSPISDEVFSQDDSNQFTLATVHITGTNFSDASGRLQVQSKHGNNYLFVSTYNNYVHIEGLQSRRAQDYIKAFNSTLEFYRKHGGVQPKLQILDNETSQLLEAYLQEKEISYQYVPPDNHRSNRAERAIQDVKNHLLAGLSTTHKDFPAYLWEDLLPQAELTLNMLRPYGPEPLVSAYHGLFKKPYDFKKHPIAPPGTAAVLFESPAKRASFGAHGIKSFYVGPALDHYRSWRFYVPQSRDFRVSSTAEFFPEPYPVPGASKEELILAAIQDLSSLVKAATGQGPKNLEFPTDLHSTIQELAEIYSPSSPLGARINFEDQRVQEQRVQD